MFPTGLVFACRGYKGQYEMLTHSSLFITQNIIVYAKILFTGSGEAPFLFHAFCPTFVTELQIFGKVPKFHTCIPFAFWSYRVRKLTHIHAEKLPGEDLVYNLIQVYNFGIRDIYYPIPLARCVHKQKLRYTFYWEICSKIWYKLAYLVLWGHISNYITLVCYVLE